MNPKEITKAKAIGKTVAEHYGVSLKYIFQNTRKTDVVRKRQMVQHLTKKHTLLSLAESGMVFMEYGKKYDHATILHSKKSVINDIETNRGFREDYVTITSKVLTALRKLEKEKDKDFYSFRSDVINACRMSKTTDILKNELIALL